MKIHSSENGKGLEDRIQELEYRIASAEVAVQRYRPEAEGAKGLSPGFNPGPGVWTFFADRRAAAKQISPGALACALALGRG
jgi:hypothetical protein